MLTRNLLSALALAALLAAPALLRANDQHTGQLVITIRPDVLLTAPATLSTKAVASNGASQWTAQFNLPIEVKLRLAPGTTGELSIEPLPNSAAGVDGNLSGVISVDGASQPIGMGSPATVSFTASGVRTLAVAVALHGNGAPSSASLPLRYTLRSSDGAISWTSSTQLNWTAQQ